MQWYMIPGFNGYEINENLQIRSMKMFRANPGHLLKKQNGKYVLSNDHNKRVRITPEKAWELVQELKRTSPGDVHVREDTDIHITSRNHFPDFYPPEHGQEGEDGKFYMDFSAFYEK